MTCSSRKATSNSCSATFIFAESPSSWARQSALNAVLIFSHAARSSSVYLSMLRYAAGVSVMAELVKSLWRPHLQLPKSCQERPGVRQQSYQRLIESYDNHKSGTTT